MNDSDLQLFKNQHSRSDIISVKYTGAYVQKLRIQNFDNPSHC